MAPAAAAAPPPGGGGAADLPIEGKTVKAMTMLSLKRTHDLFVGSHGQKVPLDEEGQRVKLACKVRAEKPRPFTAPLLFSSAKCGAARQLIV
jgi:pleiotropic regulator 1